MLGCEAWKNKQNVTCFIWLLNPCLKQHNKNVYKSYFYAFLKTGMDVWWLPSIEWHKAIGQAVGSIYANSFHFGMAAPLKLKAFKHIQHKFRGGIAFFLCCHLLHIPVFSCSPAQWWIMQKDEDRTTETYSWEQDWRGNDAHACGGPEWECDIWGDRKGVGMTCVQAATLFLSNEVTTLAGKKKISINKEELLSHATLIWLARHFHYMLMNYGWWELLSPSECNWTFINQLLKCQTVWNIRGSCCYFGDESKQTQNLELIEKRIHVDK